MDEIIGTIKLFAGNFAPKGYMLCEGQQLSIAQYQALFSILGTQYGGDGTTNFLLPKIEPVEGANYIIAISGVFPQRN
jgi:microcystin-dependent protein